MVHSPVEQGLVLLKSMVIVTSPGRARPKLSHGMPFPISMCRSLVESTKLKAFDPCITAAVSLDVLAK
jgi:hypothetical protein